MKIALFSDIHANIFAFNAMLRDMDNEKPDAVYCLGDMVGYHIYPNEVIDEIRKRAIPAIKGNHDEKVSDLTTTPESLMEPGKKHAYHLINYDNRRYLRTLPAHIRLEYNLGNDKLNIVFAHGSTRKIDEYILVDTDEDYVKQMLREDNADLLFVGHSHKPFHRVLQDGGLYKHVINLGSVGKPKDGDPRACYVLLTLNEGSSCKNKTSIGIEFRRVEYDVEAAIKALEESPLPNEFAEALRKSI